MANAFYGDRFVLDTAGAALLNTTLSHLPLPIKVRGVRWVGVTTDAHQAVLHDANDLVIWEAIATQVGDNQESAVPFVISTDFSLQTLGSGILYLYLDT